MPKQSTDTAAPASANAAERVRLLQKPSTSERVESLRILAKSDPLNAQDATWAWIQRMGRLAAKDRERAARELDALFALGLPPENIDGPVDGLLVSTMFGPRSDALARRVLSNWTPWRGKRFHASEQRGENLITSEARWAFRLIWPSYGARPEHDGANGFDFETRIERGAVEPAIDVLVVDYARAAGNPRRIVPRIRDEVVEIVPGTFLGRGLWLEGDGSYKNVAYFALRNNQF